MGKKLVSKYEFPNGTQVEKITEALKFLGLDSSSGSFEHVAQKVQESHGTLFDFLEQLLQIEFAQKEDSRVSSRIIRAKLSPTTKTLQEFDFSFQPSIDPVLINELVSCRFIEQGKNVIILGPPGVGKTFLATGLALEAINQGKSTRCMKLEECVTAINSSSETAKERLFKVLAAPELLIVDDIDYYHHDDDTGLVLHDVLKHRYEHNLSTVVTSNKNPVAWLKILGTDNDKAKALLDRLMDRSRAVIINIQGNSYRVPKPETLKQMETTSTSRSQENKSITKKSLQAMWINLKS